MGCLDDGVAISKIMAMATFCSNSSVSDLVKATIGTVGYLERDIERKERHPFVMAMTGCP